MLRALLILLAASSNFVFADPVEQIEGRSSKEKELRWLWKYTGDIVSACAANGPECQDPAIKPIIDQLAAQFPSQPESAASAWGQRLKFESEAKNPGLFETGVAEAHRLAVTTAVAGADVIVNTDRMESVDNLQWIGHFVHETVHHLGILDDERRLPDFVGAAVATYAARNFYQTDLSEFGHAEDHILIINPEVQDRPIRMLVHVRDFAIDSDMTPNSRVPICAAGESFSGQRMDPVFWRTTYVRGEQGYLWARGSSRVFNICKTQDGSPRAVETAFIFNAELKFWERFDNRDAWWTMRSEWTPESLAAGNYDGDDVKMDLGRTFGVEMLSQVNSQVNAGEEMKTTAVVYSTDGFVPQSCGAALSGSKWFFHHTGNVSMFDWYQQCAITPLGDNRYRIDATTRIPREAQPDTFRLYFFYFQGEGEPRYAFPGGKIQYVDVLNPSASPRMKASGWETAGMEPRTTMMGAAIKNSFRIEYDQPFEIVIGLKGDQELSDVYLDLALIVNYNGEYLQLPWNFPAEGFPEFVRQIRYQPMSGGKLARIQLAMPRVLQGMEVAGFKLIRASFKTNDYTWVEANTPSFLEAYFLTDDIP